MTRQVAIIDTNRNGVASIRSLGRQGYSIIALDHSAVKPGQYSRYVQHRVRIKKPQVDERAFIDTFLQTAKRYGRQEKIMLLPVNDEYVLTLAKHWPELSDWYEPLFETNIATLHSISNKLRFSEFASRLAIPQPKRWSRQDVEGNLPDYPLIIKPDNRRTTENLNKPLFKVKLCKDRQTALGFMNQIEATGTEYILQSYVPGEDCELFTAGVAAFSGRLIGCFTGRKVRQFPPKAGQASLAEIVFDQKLVDYSRRIVEELGYTGIAQIEFKRWGNDFYVIEMNPRSWSWHSLAQYAGVDLPLLVAQAAQGHKFPETVLNRKDRGYWYFFLEDLVYNWLLHRNVSLAGMLKDAIRAKAHAFFDPKDPLPWLVHMSHDLPVRLAGLIAGRKRKIDID